jgi:outer membrane immunogenic protein
MRHRKVCAALAGLVLMAGSAAYAADMPVKAPPPPPPAPVYNWNGFYLGVNLGGVWSNNSGGNFSGDMGGVTGGGTVGWNWVTNNAFFGGTGLLLGFEGDFNGTSQDNTTNFSATVPRTVGQTGFSVENRIPWFATARGRLGWVNGPWLIYATGGGAWVNFQSDISASRGGVTTGTVTDHTTQSGWTVGGGVEWMFLPRWSAKLEYLYLETNGNSVTLFNQTFEGRARENIVRAGLNYHF